MKTTLQKMIDRKKKLESELAAIDRELSARTNDANHISAIMLDALPFNTPFAGRKLREVSRAWRKFLELPERVQFVDLERCNISVEKTGVNGRRFIRREF